ncbi:4-hydroxythreonine-4-phosphate dehydrogenase PdxA [Alterisphingorhabdus coralli]|uniref:4-hydroxythreonine-4-phosphate dehydrogenase n=1 Tax=Alterisphingorhabdus coralli TaxID=3071408 RepID=A0AA97F6N4_9SPHN|nr:4-hydroxythreonine-4-phosphate dehydrogenase PdxA [Parasphingorhabdus sp. SCSIO 66989]WOE74258.1 4-hydroxythreonine-4-phosphate dehydrogenase PdxA [Parasphingorhabdus sp. SCSIO 66989]
MTPAVYAISSGDPAGIGPEIIGKSWLARKEHQLAPFFAIGCSCAFESLPNLLVERISNPEEATACFDRALPVLNVQDCSEVVAGQPDTTGAQCALQALELGVGLARTNGVAGIITGPVSKDQLQKVGFTHPGQTEFIAERCGVAKENAVMMLAGPSLRVVPITVHIPVSEVPSRLTAELIKARARTAAKGMHRNFGLENPRIAVAGLNPHAGENGRLGNEEQDIIAPAIAELREEGLNIVGPLSADTMFHAAARENYDVALCQYHDQALIPIKALHFDDGVNMTLGLPIIRTSPDHGTAFNIAGQGIANPTSMIAAIKMAMTARHHRDLYGE